MELCELGTENLHIMLFCKYQINENRNSGSHTVIQGVNEKIKLFFKSFLRSKYTPVQNMLTTICCVTVSFIKMGTHHRVVLAHVNILFFDCFFYVKMVEWNHRNMLWLKQQNDRAVFRCRVLVNLNRF